MPPVEHIGLVASVLGVAVDAERPIALLLRSTKEEDRNKAMQIVLEWERVDKKLAKLEMVENQVRQVINDILERVGEPAIPIAITDRWLREWLADREVGKSGRTVQRYKKVVDDFLVHLGERAFKPLTVVTPREVQSFILKRQRLHLSPATVNIDAEILRAAFSRARRQGIIQTNLNRLADKDHISMDGLAPGAQRLFSWRRRGPVGKMRCRKGLM